MTLESKQLKEIRLSDAIVDAASINDVFQHVNITDKGLSAAGLSSSNLMIGSSNIASQIESCIIAGSENATYASNSFCLGKSNQLGTNGFKIISVNKASSTVDCKFEAFPDDIVGLHYGLICDGTVDITGVVTACEKLAVDKMRLTLSKWNYNLDKDYADEFFLFIVERPELGMKTDQICYIMGENNRVYGDGGYAVGKNHKVLGNYGYAEGKSNVVNWGSHAEGSENEVLGSDCHGEGRYNVADSQYSHVEGHSCSALGYFSHAAGIKSVALSSDIGSFVWQGSDFEFRASTIKIPDDKKAPYYSHGKGSFNINPVDGISGFYIGTQNLHTIINAFAKESSKVLSNETFYLDEITIDDLLSCIATKLGATVYKTRQKQ